MPKLPKFGTARNIFWREENPTAHEEETIALFGYRLGRHSPGVGHRLRSAATASSGQGHSYYARAKRDPGGGRSYQWRIAHSTFGHAGSAVGEWSASDRPYSQDWKPGTSRGGGDRVRSQRTGI